MLTPRKSASLISSPASLLERAIHSRANVLLEGATEQVRAVLAQGIHARSHWGSGRLFLSLRTDLVGDQAVWPDILAGKIGAFLETLGIKLHADPVTVGTLHLERLDRLSPARQAALGMALWERDDLLFGAGRSPRIIGGLDAGEGISEIEPRLRRALAVVHVPLVANGWERLVQEWSVENPPDSERTVRLEWW